MTLYDARNVRDTKPHRRDNARFIHSVQLQNENLRHLTEKQRKNENSLDFCPAIDYLIEKVARPIYGSLMDKDVPMRNGRHLFLCRQQIKLSRDAVGIGNLTE